MENSSAIFKLQVMTLLDSTSYGLLYAFVAPYMIHLGGDQITVGIFTVTTLIFQLMSIHIVRDMVNSQGQRAALCTIFNIAAICHSLIFLTSSTCFIIMTRCIFVTQQNLMGYYLDAFKQNVEEILQKIRKHIYLLETFNDVICLLLASTNQSTNLIKNCLVKKVSPERKDYHMTVNEIMNASGFIIGPIVTGSLFDISFPCCCFLSSFLCIINIWLLTTLPEIENSPSEPSDVPVVRRCRLSVERSIEELKNSSFSDNWDVLAIKYLFSCSVIITSTKYSPVLKHNYQTSHTEIGLVTSYMTMMIYISVRFSAYLTKNKLDDIDPLILMNGMFSVLLTSLYLVFYAPLLALYCLMIIPATLSRIIIIDSWGKFIGERNNPFLDAACNSANILAGLTIPLIFGVFANEIGYLAVIYFSIFPIFLAVCIINYTVISRKQKRDLGPDPINERPD